MKSVKFIFYEKKLKCPYCKNVKTQRRGVRRGKIKYYCRVCRKWFQINRASKKVSDQFLTLLHLDGIPFRSLSEIYGMSLGGVYNKVNYYLKSLPHCADITRRYCGKYSGILLVDGKYAKVKGYERKIPVLYGVDYFTHDIPTYRLSESENYLTCKNFFASLRLLNYPLEAIVCDDNENIYEAARYIYPRVIVQLCQNHFKENIRKSLDLNNNVNYETFMREVEELFLFKRSPDDFNRKAKDILNSCKNDSLLTTIMVDIYKNQLLLTGWRQGHNIPTTTNLIESLNSHLQGRLKTIKGFESFSHANLWFNGYFIRRRLKKFTGCEGKFIRLNGYNSLQKSKKQGVDIPTFFNIKRDRF